MRVLIIFSCVDALLGKFVETLEGKVQSDYAVIYTSSAAKVRELFFLKNGIVTEGLIIDT